MNKLSIIKNLLINKKSLYSLLLAGTISLNAVGCTRDIVKRHQTDNVDNPTVTEEVQTKEEVYINKYGMSIDLKEINEHAYVSVEGINKATLCSGANVYFISDWNVDDEIINDKNCLVNVISSNGKYTLIELPTGEKGYVGSGYLVELVNVHNSEFESIEKHTKLANSAYLYNDEGVYIDYLKTDEECYVIECNDTYSLIRLLDGRMGYVVNGAILNLYQKIDGYAFVNAGTHVYSDKKLTNVYRTTDNEILHIEYTYNYYATLYEGDKRLYVRLSDIHADFIDINLNTQRMTCYLDYQYNSEYATRTGSDKTPTHVGAFDIDLKYKDFTFEEYPDCKAKYAIAYNEDDEEMIHDLIGDDEWNYGNQSYHGNGSHGCVRSTQNGSKFVYENYNVGDMVLVRKR